ncbi:phosphatase PAP2 family protein [Rufibacter tibetensis]|uniref:Phosphatidic acid phosphatase type 2/haloperoxidase domain-containing protein n=1 Tax=Rufibacter tibetensis TaxID=512763 RepID=A0A0P0CMS3_9BACT|nr:phosphatase PAP2 family protein [Rufibacter tibetensis]ALJ00986.1 hypothetical protein DC20_20810 [Rufibacter tibetensis]
MKKMLLLPFLLLSFFSFAQHLQESVSGHYKALQQVNAAPNPERALLDTVQYPAAEYGSSVTYLLVPPHYLTRVQLHKISHSVKAPANSSDQTRQELDYLLQLQKKRTPEQEQRVTFLGNIGYWPQMNFFPGLPSYQENLRHLFFEGTEVLGPWATAENLPQIARLLQGVMLDMRVMEFTVKYQQLRPRPYHLEPALKPMARMSSPAFASGHTLWAFLQAYTWSEIIPEKREAFLALAEEIRKSREIMGIHYPSDNEAARLLAHQMLTAYFQNEAFKADL